MDQRKNQTRWIALLAGAAIALYGCWLLLTPFLGVLTWSIVMAVMFYPVHRRILAWTGWPRLSALISTAVAVAVIVAPVMFATLAVVRELPGLARDAQHTLNRLLGADSPLGEDARDWIDYYVGLERLHDPEFLLGRVQELAGLVAKPLIGVIGDFVGLAVQMLFVIYTLYYLFKDGPAFLNWLRTVLPLEEAQNSEIIKRTGEMIEASVYGVIVLAVVQGALGGLAFFVLGLPNAVVWGLVMVILSAIPVTGSFLVWVPAVLVLAANGNWEKALILTAWGLLVISTVDNLLRPKVMGTKARLHELFLFFSVLGGLVAFGVPGLVLGPTLVAIALGLLDVIRQLGRPSDAIRREPGLAEQTAEIGNGQAALKPAK